MLNILKKYKLIILLVIVLVTAYVANSNFTKNDMKTINYEQIATNFFLEGNEGFVQDGYDLEIVQKEILYNENVRIVFKYKLYSFPEEGELVSEVIVEPNGNVSYLEDN